MTKFPEAVRTLLDGPNYVHLPTVLPDGPRTTSRCGSQDHMRQVVLQTATSLHGYVASDREYPGVADPGGRGVDQVEGRPSGQGGCPGQERGQGT